MISSTRLRSYALVLGLLALALPPGCGGAGQQAASGGEARADWTDRELRKLDPELRTRVRRGDGARIAVKVYFFELPSDSELGDMLLHRMGETAIGEVRADALQRIAARTDVERIEPLRDVGYDLAD